MHTWRLWTSQTEWSTAMELPAEHGTGLRNCFFLSNRLDNSKRISYTQGVWRQNEAQKFP